MPLFVIGFSCQKIESKPFKLFYLPKYLFEVVVEEEEKKSWQIYLFKVLIIKLNFLVSK
jgi:hypothetical protein